MGRDLFDDEFSGSPRMKLAVIAGASEALRLRRDRKKSDDDIIQEITRCVGEILEKID